jgi:hypothetical protein
MLGFADGTISSSGSEISAAVTPGARFHLGVRAEVGDLRILLLAGLGFSGVDGADPPWAASLADWFFNFQYFWLCQVRLEFLGIGREAKQSVKVTQGVEEERLMMR